ncbi:MAG: hypothetical protein COA68_17195 [Oceanobacter sp.]|nr:MAG: hypothetical protein COA68_17195 [Oceanobacter sp.]
MGHGLSGTAAPGRSGTQSSDYREPNAWLIPQKYARSEPLNLANQESFGFFLTQPLLWTKGSKALFGCSEAALGNSAQGDEAPGDKAQRDGAQLTHVTLVWREGEREDWLRFGKPVASRILDRRQRTESYAAGQLFGLVRWASNEYGTLRSSLDIVRAVGAGEPLTPVPQIDPGGELLLHVHGWPKVARVFRLIDAIEASAIDPCEVAPDHWRHIHNRLAAREAPRCYSPARHDAWLRRRDLLS